jgi:hypothetical protein
LVIATVYSQANPIDRVVKMESENPHFRVGFYFKGFSATNQLSPEAVAAKAVARPLTNIVVLETREVFIPMKGFENVPNINNYTAVLLKDQSKNIVVLMQYDPVARRWSYRNYKE